MLSLKNKCIQPPNNKTYIKSTSGGKDNSPEGLQVCQARFFFALSPCSLRLMGSLVVHLWIHLKLTFIKNGFTHGFVVEFESEEDRDYYVKHDEAHQAFIASLSGLVDGVQALDYVPGKY